MLITVMIIPAQSGKSVTVVEFVHPPFAYQDSGNKAAKGAEVAYLTAILKDLGYQPVFTFVPFPRMLSMLQTGEADVGPFITKTEEREAFLYYSSKTVLTMVPVLVVLKDSPMKQLKKPSDLKGLKIGFSAGKAAPTFFNNSDLPPFELVSGDNTTEMNFKKLVARRFDACIELNPYLVKLISGNMGIAGAIRTLDIPGSGDKFYCVISKKSKIAADILTGINKKKFDFENYLQIELQ